MSEYDTERFPNMIHGDPVSNLRVLKSAAGWYIGRDYWDLEFGFTGPYSRESGYFPNPDLAQAALDSGDFDVRDCIENNAMYKMGALPLPHEEIDS